MDTLLGATGNDTLTGAKADDLLTGGGGLDTFVFNLGDNTDTIADFDGLGTGSNPSASTKAEVDTLRFNGAGLTAQNMILTQKGADLEISFEGVTDTKVVLSDFALADLDNLPSGLGNILFDGQTTIQDSFDVFDADSTRSAVFNSNSVTFLNQLNNNTRGRDRSNDVINAQAGNDTISGLSGDDLLRGEAGNDSLQGGLGKDILLGGDGNDILVGGAGYDTLTGGSTQDQFSFSTGTRFNSADLGTDLITDFSRATGNTDKIVLSRSTFNAGTTFASVNSDTLAATNQALITFSTATGKLFYNQNGNTSGFGTGGQFATLSGINGTEISETNTLLATDFMIIA
ncbi:MAG: hypothetical protein KME35_06530 [Aphanocapsa sp. GSE-SYN-MK-11-07L]|nr:hypothetical protein [Aphanocapsa sp. GSE-SYN-MK-11-07L]